MKYLLFIFLFAISFEGYCDKFVWNQKANYPSFPRHRTSALSIGNKGYMGLGHINSGNISQAYTDWWEYDPATNSWTQKADYPQARFACAAFTVGNKGYVGGGNEQNFGGRDEFYEFDPIANTWLAKATFPVAEGGDIGFTINNEGYAATSSGLYKYSVSMNNWTFINSASSIPFTSYSAGFVINKKLYYLPDNSTTFYMWDPITGVVSTKAPFIGNGRYAPCSFAVRGQGYIGLGYDYLLGNVAKDFYFYDPITDVWDTIPKSFPGVRRNYVPSFVIGDNAYFGTGSNGTNLGDFWGYEWKIAAGINEANLKHELVISPNPASNYLTIKLDETTTSKEFSFKIMSLDGKIVLTQSPVNETINITHYAKGVYFAVLTNANQEIVFSKKIIFN